MASLLLAASDAHAGYYSVTYTGGQNCRVVGGPTNQFSTGTGYTVHESIPYSGRSGLQNSITIDTSSSPLTATFT